MGFLRRAMGDKSARSDSDAIAMAREQLSQLGADPDQPHTTRHLLYLPSVAAAQQAARALRKPDRRIDIEPSGRKGFWLVIVTQTVVITPETIAQINSEIALALELFGGEYDRWQVVPSGR
ncbi:MAG TPA: ribonuclease E inhibitor RraB [Candidatus Limnocylindrales bacterium]